MYARMDVISHWLDAYNLQHNTNYDLMLRRIAGSNGIAALRSLTDVVEPVKGYARERTGTTEPTSLMPLNRVIDAARPESISARNFSILIDEFVSGSIKPGTEARIRATLTQWRDSSEALSPIAENSSMVNEVMPVSQTLSALGTAGLQALDYLDRGEKAPDSWKTQQLAFVGQAIEPKAQVLLMVASPVQKLIQFSAGEKPTDLPLPKGAQ